MKKLILLAFLGALFTSFTGYAQQTTATVIPVSDSIRNTTATTAIIKAGSNYSNVSLQAVITKVSGTIAGTAKLYGSLDGINYLKIATDTLALANVTTNTYIWTPGPAKYLYYKINVVGVGTMKATMKGWFIGKQ